MGRFVAEFGDEEPPFRLAADAIMNVDAGGLQTVFTIKMNGDISGQNFDGSMTMDGLGSFEVMFVDGVGYVRLDRGPWIVDNEFEQTQPLNPFGSLELSDLELVDTVQRRGRTLHVLRTAEWVGTDMDDVDGITDATLLSNVMDIYIRENGVPVLAVLDFAIEGNVTDVGEGRFDYHVEYRFSRVGRPVKIEAPQLH
jgi:hypothetical protein